MAAQEVALVLLLCFASVLSYLPYDDPCNISPSRFERTGETVEANVTIGCPIGMIRWDYPRGTFKVNFVPSNKAPFRVCMKPGYAVFIKEMYSVVDGQKVSFSAPAEDSPACIQSHKDEIHLVLVAPKTLYYVTFIDFNTYL